MSKLNKSDLINNLNNNNIPHSAGASVDELNYLWEIFMNKDETMEQALIDAVQSMLDDQVKFEIIELTKRAVGNVEDQVSMFDYVSNHGERVAMNLGLIESVEAKKARIEAEKAEKQRIEVELNNLTADLENLPETADELKELLESASEQIGCTTAKVRIALKPLYGDNPMPKVQTKPKSKVNGFGGGDRKIFDFVKANVDATEKELADFCERTFDVNDNQMPKYVVTCKKFQIMVKEVLAMAAE